MITSAWAPERWIEVCSLRIELRKLKSVTEMQEVVKLQTEIWGYGRSGADYPYPARALLALSESGGLVAAAFLDGLPIGFSAAWIGIEQVSGQYFLHSQLLGVHARHRHLGIGYHLKLYQRDFAIHLGLDRVKWTFDPLRSANANLNLRKLGAIVRSYFPHYYGDVQSHFSQGLATDRVLADWYVNSERVRQRLNSTPPAPSEIPPILQVTEVEQKTTNWSQLVHYKMNVVEEELLVEVPDDFEALSEQDQALASDWQVKLRDIFLHYLGLGYTASDFLMVQGPPRRLFYLLRKSPLEDILR